MDGDNRNAISAWRKIKWIIKWRKMKGSGKEIRKGLTHYVLERFDNCVVCLLKPGKYTEETFTVWSWEFDSINFEDDREPSLFDDSFILLPFSDKWWLLPSAAFLEYILSSLMYCVNGDQHNFFANLFFRVCRILISSRFWQYFYELVLKTTLHCVIDGNSLHVLFVKQSKYSEVLKIIIPAVER